MLNKTMSITSFSYLVNLNNSHIIQRFIKIVNFFNEFIVFILKCFYFIFANDIVKKIHKIDSVKANVILN